MSSSKGKARALSGTSDIRQHFVAPAPAPDTGENIPDGNPEEEPERPRATAAATPSPAPPAAPIQKCCYAIPRQQND